VDPETVGPASMTTDDLAGVLAFLAAALKPKFFIWFKELEM